MVKAVQVKVFDSVSLITPICNTDITKLLADFSPAVLPQSKLGCSFRLKGKRPFRP